MALSTQPKPGGSTLSSATHRSSCSSTTKARVGSFPLSLYLQQSTEYVAIFITANNKERAVENKRGKHKHLKEEKKAYVFIYLLTLLLRQARTASKGNRDADRSPATCPRRATEGPETQIKENSRQTTPMVFPACSPLIHWDTKAFPTPPPGEDEEQEGPQSPVCPSQKPSPGTQNLPSLPHPCSP